MKKKLKKVGIIALLAGSLSLMSHTILPSEKVEQSSNRTVYVCMSPNAYAFHTNSNCPLLGRCNYAVRAVTLSKAQQMGRRQCRGRACN